MRRYWAYAIPLLCAAAVVGAGEYATWQQAQQKPQEREVSELAIVYYVTVTGAGTAAANGEYLPAGQHNGETYYTNSNGWYLYSSLPDPDFVWTLGPALEDPRYYGDTNADLPANPWSAVSSAAPAPTVSIEAAPVQSPFAIDTPRAAEVGWNSGTYSTVTLRGIEVNVDGPEGGAALQGALYDAADDSLIAVTVVGTAYPADWTGALTDRPDGWVTLEFASPISLTPGSVYYIAVWGSSTINIFNTSDANPNAYNETSGATYNSWPDPGTFTAAALEVGGYAIEADWDELPVADVTPTETGTVTDSLAIVYAANVALTGAGAGSEHATAQDESNLWPDSATWTTYEDWNAGTKSNVDVETTSGSVLLAEDV